uniref:Uncharacterized protein n=1 Tax=Strigamia maritima TaxID=126957 RepID=T1IRK4_STRMM
MQLWMVYGLWTVILVSFCSKYVFNGIISDTYRGQFVAKQLDLCLHQEHIKDPCVKQTQLFPIDLDHLQLQPIRFGIQHDREAIGRGFAHLEKNRNRRDLASNSGGTQWPEDGEKFRLFQPKFKNRFLSIFDHSKCSFASTTANRTRADHISVHSQPVNLEIYSDASNPAYGCAIYVVSPTGKRSLLISKKLTAALLGARLAHYMESSLPYGYKLGTCKFFSDSQVTLARILSSKNTWEPNVTNRVFEIRSLTSTEQWFYIPTAKNSADLLTRSERSSELLTNTLWSEGPGNTQEIQYKEDQLPDPEE